VTRELAETLLCLAGSAHFLQIPSMRYLSRGGLALEADLGKLTPINARLVRLFIAAVMLLLLGLGASATVQPQLWLESELGRSLTLLLGCFWLGRALAQAWLRRVWPAGAANRALLYGLWTLYGLLALSYWLLFAAGPFVTSAAQRTPLATCPSAGSYGKRCAVSACDTAKSQLPPRSTPRPEMPTTNGSSGLAISANCGS
jgi:hypothetical protein